MLWTSKELITWQSEIINNALINLVGVSVGDAEIANLLDQIRCFLSPLPLLPQEMMSAVLCDEIKKPLLTLRAVFDPEYYKGNCDAASDLIVGIERGSHATLRIFSGLPTGRKLLVLAKQGIVSTRFLSDNQPGSEQTWETRVAPGATPSCNDDVAA